MAWVGPVGTSVQEEMGVTGAPVRMALSARGHDHDGCGSQPSPGHLPPPEILPSCHEADGKARQLPNALLTVSGRHQGPSLLTLGQVAPMQAAGQGGRRSRRGQGLPTTRF